MTDASQLDPWTQAIINSQTPGPDNMGNIPMPSNRTGDNSSGYGVPGIVAAQKVRSNPTLYGPQLPPAQGPQQATMADKIKQFMQLGYTQDQILAALGIGGGGGAASVQPAARPPVSPARTGVQQPYGPQLPPGWRPPATPGTSLSGVGGNAAAVPSAGGGSMLGTPNMNNAVLGGQIMGDPTLGGGGGGQPPSLAQGPPNNVTSFMGGPPITTGNPFGFYSPTTGNARGATWNPPTAPPSYNMGYGGGGGGGGGASTAPVHAPAPRRVGVATSPTNFAGMGPYVNPTPRPIGSSVAGLGSTGVIAGGPQGRNDVLNPGKNISYDWLSRFGL